MTDGSGKWLTAADCAARTGLTVRALRVYERAGLLKPGHSANGWRRYGPDDLMRLNTISVCSDTDFAPSGVTFIEAAISTTAR